MGTLASADSDCLAPEDGGHAAHGASSEEKCADVHLLGVDPVGRKGRLDARTVRGHHNATRCGGDDVHSAVDAELVGLWQLDELNIALFEQPAQGVGEAGLIDHSEVVIEKDDDTKEVLGAAGQRDGMEVDGGADELTKVGESGAVCASAEANKQVGRIQPEGIGPFEGGVAARNPKEGDANACKGLLGNCGLVGTDGAGGTSHGAALSRGEHKIAHEHDVGGSMASVVEVDGDAVLSVHGGQAAQLASHGAKVGETQHQGGIWVGKLVDRVGGDGEEDLSEWGDLVADSDATPVLAVGHIVGVVDRSGSEGRAAIGRGQFGQFGHCGHSRQRLAR